MNNFSGKLAVLTGGGAGIGRELARQLVERGCNVALCDISEEGLAESRRLCERDRARQGLCVTTHVADVSNEDHFKRFRDEVAKQHATECIHLLVNNAGVSGGASMFTSPREEWERTFAICWGGVYLGVRTFLPMLMKAHEGHVVNISSIAALWSASSGPHLAHTAYASAKAAVKSFTEALITDFRLNAPHLKCSVVMPGYVGTSIDTNTRKVHTGGGGFTVDELTRLRNSGRAVDGMSKQELDEMAAKATLDRAKYAPLDASGAARIILDGVQAGKWRILVGEDAKALDRHLRQDPDKAYTPEFREAVAEEAGWAPDNATVKR